uniref:Isocitrate dehydrogenase [NADP], mitochondrial n=1 Tax=Anthurium amnicola TaxID=1678845 RepID=A0A1D1YF32_9ARAE
MEPTAQKSLERLVSQRALQMSASFPCKMLVLGFFCGVCITYFFLAALTSFKGLEFGGIFSTPTTAKSNSWNIIDFGVNRNISCRSVTEEIRSYKTPSKRHKLTDDERIMLLYSAWGTILNESDGRKGDFFNKVKLKKFTVPPAPHLEDCKLMAQINHHLDSYGENGSFPPWTTWKGYLRLKLFSPMSVVHKDESVYGQREILKQAYPPWIVGSDQDNFPLTRRVQRDIWVHQHPLNCRDSNVRFLVADWERLPGFGMGAQFAGMSGLLAIAINEKRILVTDYYNRADHNGCEECRDQAFKLMLRKEAWEKGIITVKENYTSKQIWAGHTPRLWGEPWNSLQPTTEIDGNLVMNHRKMDMRWWRAQALRYLMRFQSQYTCHLLNVARQKAFGLQAAEMVVENLPAEWPEIAPNRSGADIDQLVWSSHKPWAPRPLLSMHVRMGDKACEMKVVGFDQYMHLAEHIRKKFPHLRNIWLSTEMQDVVDKSSLYPNWNFYYTKVTRQVGNTTMALYEKMLGRETSTNYPLVNFIMASDADFFVGALGSTWCFLIDGMRNTGGKVMSGYLSVNKDRFW